MYLNFIAILKLVAISIPFFQTLVKGYGITKREKSLTCAILRQSICFDITTKKMTEEFIALLFKEQRTLTFYQEI